MRDSAILKAAGLIAGVLILVLVGGGGSSVQGTFGSERYDAAKPPQANPACRSVCIDPGHSRGGPSSRIDPATGLDVADCGGEPGEMVAVWELARKVKAKLELAGYTVRLTKESLDSYVDLRARADIGNTCSIMVRLHCDEALPAVFHPAVGRFKAHGARRVDVDSGVAESSNRLALAMFPFLKGVGVSDVMEEMGGHTNNTGTAYVVSALARVPVVLIENKPCMIQDNPEGQDLVAEATVRGIDSYFSGR